MSSFYQEDDIQGERRHRCPYNKEMETPMASIAHFQRSAWTIAFGLGQRGVHHPQPGPRQLRQLAHQGDQSDVLTPLVAPPTSSSRTVFDAVSKRLGQPVIIENKPGANSTIGVAQTARAPADGYHFVSMLAAYTVNISLYKKLPYKASDFVAGEPCGRSADVPVRGQQAAGEERQGTGRVLARSTR